MIIGIGEPKEAQWSSARLLLMTWYTWLGGVSTLGGSAAERHHALVKTLTLQHFHGDPQLLLRLTQNVDERVGQQVAELVGRVALVNGASS